MFNNKSLVSVIMNCHNGERFLKNSLNSLIKQTYKNWELIFLDNCSTDNSKKILLSFKDKRIRYFSLKKKIKLYDARNQAIKKTKGKYICFLDTDDFWHKRKLFIQVNHFKNSNNNILFTNFYTWNMTTQKKYINNSSLPEGKITQSLLDNYCIGILTVMINRSIFNNLRFNKFYEIIGDFDFFIKISKTQSIDSINLPLATYRYHNRSLSVEKLGLYYNELKLWLIKNRDSLKNFNLIKIKFKIFKIKIKNLIKIFFN